MDIRTGTARSGELDIYYEDMGDENDPAVLLIMGLGAQLLLWRMGFCELLVNQGLRVIRFDNRDVGLSSKVEGRHTGAPLLPRMARSTLGLKNQAVYTLENMADDAAALLDHLHVEKAHIVGASMGGMIAQVFAARYQQRTKTLAIIFSSNNQALLPPPGPKQLLAVTTQPEGHLARGRHRQRRARREDHRQPRLPGARGAQDRRGRGGLRAVLLPRRRRPAVRRDPRQRQPAALRQADHRADRGHPRPGRQADAPVRWPGHRARPFAGRGWCCSTAWPTTCPKRCGTTSSAS